MDVVGTAGRSAGAAGAWGALVRQAGRARDGSRRLLSWCATRAGRRLVALLVVALALRLALAPFHGFFHDLDIYVSWGLGVRRHLTTAYSQGTLGYMLSNYPPLMMDFLAIWVGLYTVLAHLAGSHPTYDVFQSAGFAVYMKLPVILADLATSCVLYLLAPRSKGDRAALVVAAAYLFSPAVLFDGAVWGQTDGMMALLLVLAFVAAWRCRPALSGGLYAATVLLKPHPAVLGALLLVYLWRWQGRRAVARFVAGAGATGAVVVAPYLLPPRPQVLAFLANLNDWAHSAAHASNDAYNLWWLLGPRINFAAPYLGPLSPTAVGWLVFLPVLGLVLLGIWRDGSPRSLCLGGALAALAFFDLTTLQHERYIFPALALFLLAALYERRAAVFYALASLTAFCNMLLMVALEAPAADFGASAAAWSAFGRQSVLITLMIAELNLALLAYVAVTYALVWLRPRPAPARSGVAA